MMKKTALVMLGMFVFSSFGFAGDWKGGYGKYKEMDPEQKAKWKAVKKEKAEYFKNLKALSEKYNKASDADKEAVKKEIADAVSIQTDKDVVLKKEALTLKKEALAKMEATISEMETDKAAFVNKKVDFFLSAEGQKKIEKMNKKKKKSKKGKKAKKAKKDKSEMTEQKSE